MSAPLSHRSRHLYASWRRLTSFRPPAIPPSLHNRAASFPIAALQSVTSLTTSRASFVLARALCTAEQQSVTKPHAVQTVSASELVLSPPALVVTREYEWASILVGFEQANKYSIRAAPGGHVVGYIAEQGSFGSVVTRNVLRTRRPFTATVFDNQQNIIFRIRRPLYLISTSIFVESPEGQVLGEVHMNWHMWRRRYHLYVDKTQFAEVDSGFLAVDFDMRDVHGTKIASVNKDFTGFARELFTDARQYVLRLDPSYGLQHDGSLVHDAATVSAATEHPAAQKLAERERAVILGAAIAIDFDYFSLHSRGPGTAMMMMPPVGAPAPAPPGAGAGAGAGAAVGADVMSDAMGGTETDAAADAETSYQINDADINADPAQASSQSGAWEEPLGQHQSSESNQTSDTADESQWATFEEPDHGFDDPYADNDAWSSDNDSWAGDGGGGGGDGEGGAIGGLFDVIKGIFTDE